jgi:NSS family neurotransmitter:Na+ symporter
MSRSSWQKHFAFIVGFGGIICAGLILSFYAILAGWMMSYAIEPIVRAVGMSDVSHWVITDSVGRNLLFTAAFMLLTVFIIRSGIENGIEKWSKRLMPVLLFLLVSLICYVLTQEGSSEGLVAYLKPDLAKLFNAELLVSALGQAFFSLSLGTSVMIIYGSYVAKGDNLVTLGAQVTLIDVSIAFLAGLLIIPAMYVAQAQGVAIFSDSGELISGPTLIFSVLPALFSTMHDVGEWIAVLFFMLMSVAALTSSISMLEGTVSYAVERHDIKRGRATSYIGLFIFVLSAVIIFNIEFMFDAVAIISTQYGQPIIAMLCCVFAGWIWQRNAILKELKQGNETVENTLFWKIWPWYIKFVCPLAISAVFIHSLG